MCVFKPLSELLVKLHWSHLKSRLDKDDSLSLVTTDAVEEADVIGSMVEEAALTESVEVAAFTEIVTGTRGGTGAVALA